jgi:hypothetical protein
MSSTTGIGFFATGLWTNLDEPSDITASAISGWVTQPQVIGQLNSYIGQCFTPSGYTGMGSWDYDVIPDLGGQEYGILDQMYQVGYYRKLIRALAGAGGTQKIILQLGEGDEKISYVSAADLARVYTENVKEAQKTLNYLVNTYVANDGSSAPRTVDHQTVIQPLANINSYDSYRRY